MNKILFILSVVLLLTNCNTVTPAKIKGIPKEAFWAGGIDGGQWYLLDSVNNINQTINCKIYSDQTGELIVNKKFKLHCTGSDMALNWDELESEFSSYDGTTIYLTTIDGYGKYCSFK